MATRNIRSRAAYRSHDFGGNIVALVNEYDAAADGTCTGGTDIVQMFDLPAGTVVWAAFCEVLTVDGSGITADVGVVGGDLDGYIAAADTNTLGLTMGAGALLYTAGAYVAPLLYTTATVIQLTGTTTDLLDTAKIRVTLMVSHVV